MDLSVRTLYDQIWAYAHFINEAPDVRFDRNHCSRPYW